MSVISSPLLRLPLAVLAILVAAVVWVPPATAHTEVSGSTPNDGATLNRPPKAVTITFTQAPLPSGMAMVADGPDGPIALDPTAAGTAVTADWPQDSHPGTYAVHYRVVASDGHPITGRLSFTITARSSQPPTPSAMSSAQPAAAAPAGGPSGLLWAVIGAAVVLVAGVFLALRRGRTR